MIPSWATRKALPVIDSQGNDITGKAFYLKLLYRLLYQNFPFNDRPVGSGNAQQIHTF